SWTLARLPGSSAPPQRNPAQDSRFFAPRPTRKDAVPGARPNPGTQSRQGIGRGNEFPGYSVISYWISRVYGFDAAAAGGPGSGGVTFSRLARLSTVPGRVPATGSGAGGRTGCIRPQKRYRELWRRL